MADGVAFELADPAGAPLRIEWDTEALRSLVAPEPEPEPRWRLGGELDWEEIDGLRIVSARLAPRRLIAIAALRPRGAGGHGEELVTGAIGDGEAFEQLDEVLLSTEYGPQGAVRRIGLELYREDGGLPIRVAGDALTSSSDAARGVRHDSAAFELRCGDDAGIGILDVLSPG